MQKTESIHVKRFADLIPCLEQLIGLEEASNIAPLLPTLQCSVELIPQSRVLVIVLHTLHIKVDPLPKDSILYGLQAYKTPQQTARNYYFDSFGSICLVEIIAESVSDIHLTKTTVLRTKCKLVCCRPLWKQINASTAIIKFMRNRRRATITLAPNFSKPQRSRPRSDSFPPLRLAQQRSLNAITPRYKKHAANKYISESLCKKSSRPRAVLMFGFPGSGKNHVLKVRPRVNHIIIDVDLCLELMPGFWQGVATSASNTGMDWVHCLRNDAHSIATLILELALSKRLNILWNGTGRSLSFYSSLIDQFKEKGYLVELCGVYARSSTAHTRMKQRIRPVPNRVLLSAMDVVAKHLELLRHKADYARVWSNDGNGHPALIWDHSQGVLDTNAWNTWECPSPLPPAHSSILPPIQVKASSF